MINIIEIPVTKRQDFLDFLLLADEQPELVAQYMFKGQMYALIYQQTLCATCLVLPFSKTDIEIKNLAVLPVFQRQGLGKKLLLAVCQKYPKATFAYVGTGQSPVTMNFYQHCGFEYAYRIKNFFLDNYDHEIFEEGIQLVDMIYLKKKLTNC